MSIANNILELAAGNLAELMQGGFSQGFVPATLNKIREHFTGSDNLKRYYNQAVRRSILSLEIALKGPRAYYPSREKEFYKKHFLRFEKKIFLPFSSQLVQKGVVNSEDVFRSKCIGDCEKIKKAAGSSLGLTAGQMGDIQKILGQTTIATDLSQKMLAQLQQKAGCDFLIKLLHHENILLSGIVFHFHCFIQSDQKLSNYVNYLEMSEIKKNLIALQQQTRANPQDKKLAIRLQRLEKLTSMLSSYQNNMGAISKKLDGIYQKTVQTYEVLQRIETQMKTSFHGLEAKLDTICAMLNKKEETSASEKNTAMENKPKKNTKTVEKKQTPKDQRQILSSQNQNKSTENWEEIVENPPQLPTPSHTQNTSAQKVTNLPHKHRHNVIPTSIFTTPPIEGQKASQSVPQNPMTSSIFFSSTETNDAEESLDSCLKLYAIFLQNTDKTSLPVEKNSQEVSPEEKQQENKKSKRIRGDQISQIFMDQ